MRHESCWNFTNSVSGLCQRNPGQLISQVRCRACGIIQCDGPWSHQGWQLLLLNIECLLSGVYSPSLSTWQHIAGKEGDADADTTCAATQGNAPNRYSEMHAMKMQFVTPSKDDLTQFRDGCNLFSERWCDLTSLSFSLYFSWHDTVNGECQSIVYIWLHIAAPDEGCGVGIAKIIRLSRKNRPTQTSWSWRNFKSQAHLHGM